METFDRINIKRISLDEQLNHRLTGFPIREDKKNIFHGNKRYRNVIFNAIIPLLAIREP